MPTNRRRRASTRTEALTERARIWLQTGQDLLWFADDGPYMEEELKELWESYRDEIMQDSMQTHPGCRPWAWWVWDRGIEQPIQLADKPAETDYLDAHGLLTPEKRAVLNR